MDPALLELLRTGSDQDEEEVEAIIRLDRPQVEIEGVRIVSRFGPIATCRLPRNSILRTREEENVLSLKAARVLAPEFGSENTSATLELPSSPVDSDVRRPPGLPLTGAGIIIGVVDWGCDFDHPHLKHPDGSTRLIALWDQRRHPIPDDPSHYGYGTFYGRRQINRALGHANPYDALVYHPADSAHGTHVMDIAAGNGLGGGPVGVAPAADLIFVHLANRGTEGLANLGDSVRILEAVDFVARIAGPRPWVVNLSVGRHGGPHDGSTLAEMAFDFALRAAPGRFIVQSTGNYFNKNIHASGRLRVGQVRTFSLIVDEADITPNELEVWYSGEDAFAVRTESPTGAPSPWVRLGEHADVIENDRIIGRIYNRHSDPNNSDNHIDIFLYHDALPGLWTVALKAETVSNGLFHMWIERDETCPGCQTRFSKFDSDSFYTTGTLANSQIPLVVGAYDAHSPTREVPAFSSVGPTRDNRPKPDLVAPGVGVLAARSAPRGWHTNAGMCVRKSGTSMAAPHVTGTVALCLQGARRPLWSHEIRKLILGNVEPVATHGQDPQRLGHGRLDIAKAVEAVSALPPRVTRSLADRYIGAAENASRPKECNMRPNMIGHFDRLEQIIRASTSRAASERDFLAEVMRTNGAPLSSHSLDPDALYREIVFRRNGPLTAMIDEHFTVLARPGESPEVSPQAGDVLLRIAPGEPGLGHVALLSDATLWSAERLADSPFQSESQQPGYYATVLEGGAFSHTHSDRFARRILDSAGKMPHGQLLLRLKASINNAHNMQGSITSTDHALTSEDLGESVSPAHLSGTRTKPTGRLFSTETDSAEAGPVALAGLGLAVFQTGVGIFSRGDFSFSSSPASYTHQKTPPYAPLDRFTLELKLKAHHPRIGPSNPKFWFKLTFEFNGYDIKNANISRLVNKSSSLSWSTFAIKFTPVPNSAPRDQVAKIRYVITGNWDPYSFGDVDFDGDLFLTADGTVRININSERDWVSFEGFFNKKTTRLFTPPLPKPKVGPIYIHKVYFSPSGSARLSDTSIRKLNSWFKGLPATTKKKVEEGTEPIKLSGFASTTSSVRKNQILARKRVKNVQRILRDFAGRDVKFKTKVHGELSAKTVDGIEDRNERRVDISIYGLLQPLK